MYDIKIDKENNATIKMTLTSPNCPAIETLPEEIKTKIEYIDSIKKVHIDLVWEPPFTQDMMSDEAKLALGLL